MTFFVSSGSVWRHRNVPAVQWQNYSTATRIPVRKTIGCLRVEDVTPIEMLGLLGSRRYWRGTIGGVPTNFWFSGLCWLQKLDWPHSGLYKLLPGNFIDNKLVTVYATEKLWFGHDLRSQLRNKMDDHQSGDDGMIKAVQYQFRAGVRDAKRRFKEKTWWGHFKRKLTWPMERHEQSHRLQTKLKGHHWRWLYAARQIEWILQSFRSVCHDDSN